MVIIFLPYQTHLKTRTSCFSVFRFRVFPTHRLPVASGCQNSINRKLLKSYTNTPKIIILLSILHEQFKLYFAQQGRELDSWGSIWCKLWPQKRIPCTRFSLSSSFQVNPTVTFRKKNYFNLGAMFRQKQPIYRRMRKKYPKSFPWSFHTLRTRPQDHLILDLIPIATLN